MVRGARQARSRTQAFGDRKDCGALRLRLVATKNLPCDRFPRQDGDAYPENVILDFDYWAILPRVMSFLTRYRAAVASGELKPDAAQEQRGGEAAGAEQRR